MIVKVRVIKMEIKAEQTLPCLICHNLTGLEANVQVIAN